MTWKGQVNEACCAWFCASLSPCLSAAISTHPRLAFDWLACTGHTTIVQGLVETRSQTTPTQPQQFSLFAQLKVLGVPLVCDHSLSTFTKTWTPTVSARFAFKHATVRVRLTYACAFFFCPLPAVSYRRLFIAFVRPSFFKISFPVLPTVDNFFKYLQFIFFVFSVLILLLFCEFFFNVLVVIEQCKILMKSDLCQEPIDIHAVRR